MVPFGVRPKLQRTAMEFLIWGVRNLAPYHLLAVENPNIIIQVGILHVKSNILLISHHVSCSLLDEMSQFFFLCQIQTKNLTLLNI